MRKLLGSLLVAVPLAGCYHATVETGRAPSGVVVEESWAHSFIGGLIPPSTVEVAQQCPNGVASVETQLSLLNMLVGGVTFGIYTPMTIEVSCAGTGNAMIDGTEDPQAAMNHAVELSREAGEPVLVRLAD